MRRMLVITLAFCLTFIVALAGAVLPFRLQAPPPRLAMLHLTDCELPCWIGITPGKSTISEAEAAIDTVYARSADYRITPDQEPDPNFLLFSISTTSSQDFKFEVRIGAEPNKPIDWMDFKFFDAAGTHLLTPFTAADLHSLIGAPSSEIVTRVPDHNQLLYGSASYGMFAFIIPATYGRWDAPITTLEFFNQAMGGDYVLCPWRGFAEPRMFYGIIGIDAKGC